MKNPSHTPAVKLHNPYLKVKKLFSIVKKFKNINKRFIRLFIGFLVISIIVLIFILHFVFIAGKRVYDAYGDIKENLHNLELDIQKKNLSNMDNYISHINTDLNIVNSVIDQYKFLENCSFSKGYYKNLLQVKVILIKVEDLINFTSPKLKDLLVTSGFSMHNTNTTNINNDKVIPLIMKEFPQYLDLYSQIEPQIIDILAQIKKIDSEYLADIGNFKSKQTLEQINQFSDTYPQLSTQIIGFIKNLPPLLGVNGDTTYLLVLQTEAELRASGGIISAYGTVSVKNGQIGDIAIFDSWILTNYLSKHGLGWPAKNIYGQAYLMSYGCGEPVARAQDSPQYPDLFYSMNTFKSYYDRAHNNNSILFPSYQHIILIDNAFAQNLLKVVQPVKLEDGMVVNSDNFFELIKSQTDNTTLYHGANTDDRKTIIKTVANAVKTKFLTLPITSIPLLLNSVIQSFQAKDISLSTTEVKTQSFFDTYGLTARTVKDYTGDYFQINETQNCSLKLNLWVRDNVVNDININNNGSINENIHIHWIQPQIYNPSLIHEYEPTYNHSYRAWLRIFTPNNTLGIHSDGYKESGYLHYNPFNYYDNVMDKVVSDNIIQFDHRRFSDKDPIDKKDFHISYNLPNSINYKDMKIYTQIIQKDPGKSWGESYQINIHDGDKTLTTAFILDKDKLLTYKDGVLSIQNNDTRLDWITSLVSNIPWSKLSGK